MKRKAVAVAISSPTVMGLSSVIGALGLLLIILFWSFSSASGLPTLSSGELPSTEVDPVKDDAEVESVTMSIPLEEGAVIDLDAPATDVRIDTWEGDEVLVIVEKVKRSRGKTKTKTSAQPVNIQVTRHGKNFRIEATGGAGWDQNGMDLSFRILLPDRYPIDTGTYSEGDAVERLTSVLWRAFHREALKWLVR